MMEITMKGKEEIAIGAVIEEIEKNRIFLHERTIDLMEKVDALRKKLSPISIREVSKPEQRIDVFKTQGEPMSELGKAVQNAADLRFSITNIMEIGNYLDDITTSIDL